MAGMKLKPGGIALVVLFALAIVALGVYASLHRAGREATRSQAEPIEAAPPGPDPAEEARLERQAVRARLLRDAATIEALDAEIAAVESALAVAREEAARRFISRQDDREHVAKLNAKVGELKIRRAEAVREYRIAIAAVDTETSAGLPELQQR